MICFNQSHQLNPCSIQRQILRNPAKSERTVSFNFVIEQIGKENIKAFWLAGHSQGGMTSNRIVRTDFFKDKVDGWLSLSGGRLGGQLVITQIFALSRSLILVADRVLSPSRGGMFID